MEYNLYLSSEKTRGVRMKFVIAVGELKILKQLENILKSNSHDIEAVCGNTHDLIEYVELMRPDLVIMENDLPGKFLPCEVTKYFNDVFDVPVVYIINNNDLGRMRQVIESNPYGIITDPGDERQVNFTLELAYNKFEESLYLL
jgi:two-component system, LytTR family, response regulator